MLTKIKIIITSLAILGVMPVSALAASPSASVSLTNGTFAPESTFSVNLYEDSGPDNVNIVQSDLLYDSSELDFVSLDTSSGAFSNSVPSNGGSAKGKVKITVFSFTNVKGKALIGTITFKNLSGTSSTISGDPKNTHVLPAGGNDIWDGKVAASTNSFVVAVPTTTAPTAATPGTGAANPTVNKPAPVVKSVPTTLKPDPLTKAWVAKNSVINTQPSEPGPVNLVYEFLLACSIGVAIFVAMYFNAHVRLAQHSAARLSHKRMLMTAKHRVRHSH
jgi:hypothetical protein